MGEYLKMQMDEAVDYGFVLIPDNSNSNFDFGLIVFQGCDTEANVEPLCEKCDLVEKFECLLCELTNGKMSKASYDYNVMLTAINEQFEEDYNKFIEDEYIELPLDVLNKKIYPGDKMIIACTGEPVGTVVGIGCGKRSNHVWVLKDGEHVSRAFFAKSFAHEGSYECQC